MSARLKIIGKKFNKLKVLNFSFIKNKKAYWLCRCDCGKEKIIQSSLLKTGKTKSCGCIKRGRKFTKIHKQRISNSLKGHAVSLEVRKKIGLANKGRINSRRTHNLLVWRQVGSELLLARARSGCRLSVCGSRKQLFVL